MAQVRYIVGVTLPDQETTDRWLAWLRGGHIAEVLAGGATSATIFQVNGTAFTFEIDYRFPSLDAFAHYEQHHAPRLREEGRLLFPPDRVTYRRSTAALIEEFP
jgi:hypothetical protein